VRSVLRGIIVIGINLVVFVALLASIELYFRWKSPPSASEFVATNGLWQKFAPYVMILSAPGTYPVWTNEFTGQSYTAHVVTNALGFNDRHEFDYTKPYQKAANERVVLFTGGSVAWGVGATSTDKTIAGRMEYYLNSLQSEVKYTVINLGMGSWIAYQEFIALELWGAQFDPDWVVVMDGFNDAGVGCAYSQGVINPMYYATMQAYIESYLLRTQRPVFYRGWLENELIRWSAAYRTITGKQYVPDNRQFDDTSHETQNIRRTILPTKVGEARAMLDFYLKAQKAMLGLFPKAHYILSTQPIANQIAADFTDIYDDPAGSEARRLKTEKREADVDAYLKQYEANSCSQKNREPAYVYILVNGAIRLERLVQEEAKQGRDVQYSNVGLLLPKDRDDRLPFFIDSAHMGDSGYDLVARYYADKILARSESASPK
jgi:hypothetical protein